MYDNDLLYDGSEKEILQEWDLVHMLDSARYGMTDYDLTSDPFAQVPVIGRIIMV